jgi:phospholipid/cholesterol/gamma-HCH transport system substrate-binding protein
MSPNRRNIVVGLTVIGGLLALGWMMMKFGNAPVKAFQKGEQVPIRVLSDRADGLAEGSQIFYRGVTVGRVTHLRRDDNQQDIIIDAVVDDTPPLPGNLVGIIRTRSLISGNADLSLELDGGPTTVPTGRLVKDQTLRAKFVGSELIPQQFGELAIELEKTTRDVREARLIAHLDETIRSAGEVMKSLHDYVSDPQLRENVSVAIANFRKVTETANRATENIERFSGNLQKVSDDASATLNDARATIRRSQDDLDSVTKQMNDRLLQISKLLDTFQSISTKIDKGDGTAGKLLNDPKLYQSLVETSRDLNATIADLRRLVAQWEQEGVSFRLNK